MCERALHTHSLWHPPVSTSPALVLLTLTYNQCASTGVTCACLYALSEMRSPPLVPLFCKHPHNLLKAGGSLLNVTAVIRRWRICVSELSDTGRQKWSLHTHCSPAVVCPKQTERWCYSGLGQLYELWEAATLQTKTGRIISHSVFLSVAMMKRQTSHWYNVQCEGLWFVSSSKNTFDTSFLLTNTESKQILHVSNIITAIFVSLTQENRNPQPKTS